MSMPYGKVTNSGNFLYRCITPYYGGLHHHERDGSHVELGNPEQFRCQPHSFTTMHSGQEHLTQSFKSVPIISKNTVFNFSFPLGYASSNFQTTL